MTFKNDKLYKSSELSNEDYHGTKSHFSSSQLKDVLVDVRLFYRQHISGEIEKTFAKQTQITMDIGTYYHTAILEPDELPTLCVVWDGIRRGKAWEEFELKNKGKIILTLSDFEKAQVIIDATKKDPVTMDLIKSGEAEVSTGAKVDGVNVRVRADWVDFDRGFVLDLKSTTGSVYNIYDIQKKIDSMNYDMSAALYVDTFNRVLAKKDMPLLKDFYWSFASKDNGSCQVYKASEEMMAVGRAKYKEALRLLRENIGNKWKFSSDVVEVGPLPWQKDLWIKKEEKQTQALEEL